MFYSLMFSTPIKITSALEYNLNMLYLQSAVFLVSPGKFWQFNSAHHGLAFFSQA